MPRAAAAKAIVERARAQVADLVGCGTADVVFTSGATEAASQVISALPEVSAPATEHDCVFLNPTVQADGLAGHWKVSANGVAMMDQRLDDCMLDVEMGVAVSAANSETGVLGAVPQEEGALGPCGVAWCVARGRGAGPGADPVRACDPPYPDRGDGLGP